MKFILDVPSLTHIALVNLAISLWKSHYAVYGDTIVRNFHYTSFHYYLSIIVKCWDRDEQNICDDVKRMKMLPKNFQQPLILIVRNIGYELKHWLRYLTQNVVLLNNNDDDDDDDVKCNNDIMLMIYINNTRWTAQGKVDVKKSALSLSNHEGLSDIQRYIILCTFCLINEEDHNGLSNIYRSDNRSWWDYPSITFEKIAHSSRSELRKFTQYESIKLLAYAVHKQNVCAVKYIWSELTQNYKIAYLTFSLVEPYHDPTIPFTTDISSERLGRSDVTYFLLSNMNEELFHIVMHSDYWFDVITSLLKDWVYVKFIIPMLKCREVGNAMIEILLPRVAFHLMNPGGENYEILFTYLLASLTPEYKMMLISVEKSFCHPIYSKKLYTCCEMLCLMGDLDTLKLFFKDVEEIDIRSCLTNVVRFKWPFFRTVAKKFISTNKQLMLFRKHCALRARCMILNIFDASQCSMIDDLLEYSFSQADVICDVKKLMLQNMLTDIFRKGMYNDEKRLILMDKYIKWGKLPANEIVTLKDKLRNFLEKLFSKPDNYNCTELVDYDFSFRYVPCAITNLLLDEQFEFLDKFFCWCSFASDEIVILKRKLIRCFFHHPIIRKMFQEGEMKFIDRYLSWCYDNQRTTIYLFKKIYPYTDKIDLFMTYSSHPFHMIRNLLNFVYNIF
jgi:hypothetical protein